MSFIIGAGLSGLIAAHAFPRRIIYEVGPEPAERHKALLRFRSTAVSELTGIPFRKVTVRKGIWEGGSFRAPTIALANAYSRKCLGALFADRSIWNLDPVERYVAPDDFYWLLQHAVRDRIEYGFRYDHRQAIGATEPVITTAPLPVVLEQTGIKGGVDCRYADISVLRFQIANCELFQTVYFPSASHTLYRASITGSTLICEFAGQPLGDWKLPVAQAFGIAISDFTEDLKLPGVAHKQSYGKIAPLPNDAARKSLIGRLTSDHNIMCLGRFATWRNVLLDDVVHDAAVLKRLMNVDNYQRRLFCAQGV